MLSLLVLFLVKLICARNCAYAEFADAAGSQAAIAASPYMVNGAKITLEERRHRRRFYARSAATATLSEYSSFEAGRTTAPFAAALEERSLGKATRALETQSIALREAMPMAVDPVMDERLEKIKGSDTSLAPKALSNSSENPQKGSDSAQGQPEEALPGMTTEDPVLTPRSLQADHRWTFEQMHELANCHDIRGFPSTNRGQITDVSKRPTNILDSFQRVAPSLVNAPLHDDQNRGENITHISPDRREYIQQENAGNAYPDDDEESISSIPSLTSASTWESLISSAAVDELVKVFFQDRDLRSSLDMASASKDHIGREKIRTKATRSIQRNLFRAQGRDHYHHRQNCS